jgi:hypothetical protein
MPLARRDPSPERTLLLRLRSYRLIRRSRWALSSFGLAAARPIRLSGAVCVFFEGGFHVLEGAVDRVFTDWVVLEFLEFVEAIGYPLNAAALRAETIRWESLFSTRITGSRLYCVLSVSAARRLFHACRGYRRIYGAVLRLCRCRLDPNVHNDDLPLVEHQLVRVEAQRSRPDLAGF